MTGSHRIDDRLGLADGTGVVLGLSVRGVGADLRDLDSLRRIVNVLMCRDFDITAHELFKYNSTSAL